MHFLSDSKENDLNRHQGEVILVETVPGLTNRRPHTMESDLKEHEHPLATTKI